MKALKVWHFFTLVACVLFVLLCIYGLSTDCPNTAGYIYCSGSDGWSLHPWSSK